MALPISARFVDVDGPPQDGVGYMAINRRPALGEANRRVMVFIGDRAELVVDVYLDGRGESTCFQSIKTGPDCVVIGYGAYFHFIRLSNRWLKSVRLSDYFGEMYPVNDLDGDTFSERLLVCSGSQMYCIDSQGDTLWHTVDLAVDGVLVHQIRDDIISGDAEWDPPGDWRPFQLCQHTGRPIGNG